MLAFNSLSPKKIHLREHIFGSLVSFCKEESKIHPNMFQFHNPGFSTIAFWVGALVVKYEKQVFKKMVVPSG